MTGLAQINGRNHITWEDKLQYDVKYTKKITFLGDIKICLQTVGMVFKQEGISEEGMATAEDLGDYLLRTRKIDRKKYDRCQRMANQMEIRRSNETIDD